MTKKEEAELHAELHYQRQVVDFLAHRILKGEGGISSDALIAEAVLGYRVAELDYPSDLSDLARCLQAWLAAPAPLRAKMLWRLSEYTSHVSEKHISPDGVR
jgi:hypothetical protein